MQQWFPVERKTAGPVGHHALALCGTNSLTKIGFRVETEITLATLRRVERNHMITGFYRGNACAYLLHDARPFVAKNGGECTFRIIPRKRKSIGMADTCRFNLH